MTTGKEFLGITVNPKMAFILRATVAVAVVLIVFAGTPAQAQTCRTVTNLPIQNLVDFQNSTVTNLGSNNFRIHWAYVSDPSITLICADSGLNPPCGFDGVFGKYTFPNQYHVIAESDFGACNLKTTITTDGGNFVYLFFELRFELNGNPSKQQFGPAAMSTDPNVIAVGQTLPLSQLLL